MRFDKIEDAHRNLDQSVFYNPKLRKAYRIAMGEGFQAHTYSATEDGFKRRAGVFDVSKEFHLTGLRSGFAPRRYGDYLLLAERTPMRQWHFGWTTGNTIFSKVFVNKDELKETPIRTDRNWWTEDRFIGTCWTGAFASLKSVLEDGVGALTPSIAIYKGFLVSPHSILGKVNGDFVALYKDNYNSFLVRELKDLGFTKFSEIEEE